jgi:hypothetical protein
VFSESGGEGKYTNRIHAVKVDAVETEHVRLFPSTDHITVLEVMLTKLTLLLLIVWKACLGCTVRSLRKVMLYQLKAPPISVFSTHILILCSDCLDLILAGTSVNIKIMQLKSCLYNTGTFAESSAGL